MGLGARFTAAAYAAALASLRPRGRMWPEEAASCQVQTLAAAAGSFERLDAAAQGLLTDAFPATAQQLLPEWENSLGLPDPCVGEDATVAQRQAQLVARLTATGSQAPQRYIDYATSLGFQIQLETFAPFRCGFSACGDGLGGPEWSFAWAIKVSQPSSQGFAAGVLLCEFAGMAPAEPTVFLAS